MGRKVIEKEVVYHKEDGTEETAFELISDQKLRDKGAIPRRKESGDLTWHIYTGKTKETLIDYLKSNGFNSQMISEVFSSLKMYYRRNDKPSGLLLVEALRVSESIDVPIEKFVSDLKNKGIL